MPSRCVPVHLGYAPGSGLALYSRDVGFASLNLVAHV